MKIGTFETTSMVALAPMAGTCDRAFRELCVQYGAGYVVGEMASSKGISMKDKKSKELLYLSEIERPAAVQIFGNDPETMAQAAQQCLDYSPEAIDINMGCPAPKVAMNGGGSSLMKDPLLAGKITRAVVDAVKIPVTVKIRAGWDSESINAPEMAKILEASGASAITVHGRTRMQMYSGKVDYSVIRQVKNAVSIPVIGNGDIVDTRSASTMLEKTNCDMIMVGRGALGSPWLFQQLNAYLEHGQIIPSPPVAKRMLVMITHIKKLCEYKGEHIGMREARKHAAWYTKGLKNSASFRREIGRLSSIEQLEELAYKIIRENQGE